MSITSRYLRQTVLAASIATLIACGGAEERKSVYMEKALASIEQGDYDKARVELKNVLQIDPKDAEAHYQLGKVFENQKNIRKAFSHYLRAEELDGELIPAQVALGKIYLLMSGSEDKAQQKIDFILSKDPNHPGGLLLKAAQFHKHNQRVKAKELAEKIVSRNPEHIDSVVFLSTIYFSQKEYASAANILEKAVELHPSSDKLSKLYALTLVKSNQNDKAEEVYKDFIRRNESVPEGYNLLAAFYHENGKTDLAEQALLSSINIDPDNPVRILTYIKYIKAVRGDSAAIDSMKKYVENNRSLGELRNALAELYMLSEQKDKAISTYKGAIEDFSEELTGVEARISLAGIYIANKDYAKAKETVSDALEVSPNDAKVNLLQARLALMDGDIEQAIISLRVVTNETPENIDAFILLARAYEMEGNDEQKRSILNRAYEANRLNTDALLKLARYYLSSDIEQAEIIIDDFNNIKKNDYDGLSIKAAILNQKKSYAEAVELANILAEKYPEKPNGYLQAVPQLTSTGQIGKAESLLEKGYLNTEDNRKILNVLTQIQVAQKKYDVVEKRIDAELSATPDDPVILGMLANVYTAKGDSNSAIQALEKIIETNPQVEESYLLISQIYEKGDKLQDAIETLKQGENNLPESVKIKFKLATLHEKSGEHIEALNVYRKLYDKSPDNMIIANNLASLLSDYGTEEDLVLARSIADDLKDAEQSVFLDTVGWIYYKSGNYEQAVKYLETAVTKSPDVNIFHYHLGMAYKLAGDSVKAKTHLEKSLELGDGFKYESNAKEALKSL